MWKKRQRRVHSPRRTKSRAAGIGLICLALAGGAGAQGASFGQPTPGICFLSRERVLDQSKAGAAANQRMQLFIQGVAGELSGERAAIGADANVLQIQKPVISESIYQQ